MGFRYPHVKKVKENLIWVQKVLFCGQDNDIIYIFNLK